MNELTRTHQLELKEKRIWDSILKRTDNHLPRTTQQQAPPTEFQLLIEEARRDSRSMGVKGQGRM